MSHPLLCSHPHPLVTLAFLAKGNFPLPHPQFNTLGQVIGLLNGVEVLDYWFMSVSSSEVMSTTTELPLD